MNYKLLSVAASFALAISASAAPLTPDAALARIGNNSPMRVSAAPGASPQLVWTELSEAQTPVAYVFNMPETGYMVVSGDDQAFALLGYSQTGRVDASSMPEALKWWLAEYGRQMEWSRMKGIPAAKAPVHQEGRVAVEPLLQTKWDQGKPYNNLTPSYNGMQTYTGCVATSMAQVMNYFKYPEVGEGIKQYRAQKINKRLTLNFAQRAFDWDNMLDAYYTGNYTEEQADAVAYLMKACGYSVEMNYGTDASGASGFDVAPALRNYFKYDKSVVDRYRVVYSSAQWDEMMYDNLKNVGPVIINGQSPIEGGHSFVCDGYDGHGYYHFNWGWNGMSDGYYVLDALNPEAQGIGGAGGGFNFHQNAIFGIRPDTGGAIEVPQECLFQYGSTVGSISGRTLTFDVVDYSPLGWGNQAYEKISVNIGAIIEGDGSRTCVKGLMGTTENLSLTQGAYYPNDRIKPVVVLPSLPDGNYKVVLACKPVDADDSKWIPVEVAWGYSNYLFLSVSGNSYAITDVTPANIAFSDIENLTPVYSGKNILFKAKVSNTSDMDLCQGLSFHLCNSNLQPVFYGEGALVTVNAGETDEREFVTKFYRQDGQLASVTNETSYVLRCYNPQNGLYYPDVAVPVTLLPNPGSANVMLTSFTMPADRTEEVTIDGRYFPMLSIIGDPSDLDISLSFKVKSGYYDGMVSFDLGRLDPAHPYNPRVLIDGIYQEWAFTPKNETKDINFHYDFSAAEEGVVYFIIAKYTVGNSVKEFSSKAFMYRDPNAVETILDEQAPESYFNLQGLPVANPEPGQLIIVRKGGKTFKKIH